MLWPAQVCLSLLGTWEVGEASEGWTTDSTLLQVFVSIQSLIFVQYPYFNEPGEEMYMGSPEATRAARVSSNGGYETLRPETLAWAVADMIANPPAHFEEVVRQHFAARGARLLKVMEVRAMRTATLMLP